jgi:hypothetical protein
LSIRARLDPLAPTSDVPDSGDEAKRTVFDIGAVVLAHDLLDGLGSLVGVVEGDGRDVVVENVGLDDAVEEAAADETELTVDSSSGTASVGPGLSVVVRKGRVSVLKVGDGNCISLALFVLQPD